MPSRCTLTVNGKPVRAAAGETLVDAALGGRIVIPHDCLSGTCETCRVTVLAGEIDDLGTRERETVLACQATLEGDAEIRYDEVPYVRNAGGRITRIAELGPDILEVRVEMRRPFPWLPGQYVRLTLAGYPPRDYSPTFGLDREAAESVLVFHVRRYPGGVVSGAIATDIRAGHRVSVRGPYGHAFLRPGDGRLVLLSTGTGWAPIWAVALAARLGQPGRAVEVIAGARAHDQLYMRTAADWLAASGAKVTLTAGDGDGAAVRRERPWELLPRLGASDTIHAAGSPKLASLARLAALHAEAVCYADPFTPHEAKFSLSNRIIRLLRRRGSPSAAEAQIA